MSTFHVSAYGLDDPEDEEHERFMRKLLGRRPHNPRQDVLDDYYEECKAEAQAGGEEEA
jgi:hypothetical protein